MMQVMENEQNGSVRSFGTGRRLCAFLLTLALLLGLLPVSAFAFSAVTVWSAEELRFALEDASVYDDTLVNLGGSYTLDAPITVHAGARLTLDLNGHTLTAGEPASSEGPREPGPMFTVPSGAELVIRSGASDRGTIQGAALGAILVEDGGALSICSHVDICKCRAEKGAAVYVSSGGTATLGADGGPSLLSGGNRYCTLNNCEASVAGGAVYVEKGGVLLFGEEKCEIYDCKAETGCGGAIYVETDGEVRTGTGDFEIYNCNAERGGGVYAEGGNVALKTVRNNTAAQGGGVYVESGSVSCTELKDNSAIQGGGVFCSGSFAMGSGTATVSGNKAEQGGGVFVAGTGSVVLSELSSGERSISGNRATGYGGAFYISCGGKVTLASVALRDNTATFCGGAVYADSPAEKQGSALLKFQRGVSLSGNKANENPEDVYLSAATFGQIGARDLATGTVIRVTLPDAGTARGVIRDVASLPFFVIGGQQGGTGSSFSGETEEDEPGGSVSYNGEVEDFGSLKATLEKGISVKLLRDITVTKPITISPAESGELKLDLNGKTLSAADSLDGRMFTLTEDAVLTIETAAGIGTIKNAPMGAVHVQDGARLKVHRNVLFENCTADNGGAIRVDAGGSLAMIGTVSIVGVITNVDDVYFRNCRAAGNGGGVFVDGGKIEVDLSMRANFEYCEAACGGGLYLEKKTMTGNLSFSFSHCTASQYGGGLYTAESDHYGNCSFQYGNAAKGGGIFLAPGASYTSSMSGFICAHNTASVSGGGIYVSDGAKLSLSNTENARIEANKAENGGGIYAESSAVLELKAQMTGNEADGKGGFLYLASGAYANIADAEITDNAADIHGGAIYMEEPAAPAPGKSKGLDFSGTLKAMSGNKAVGAAEDIYLSGSSAGQLGFEKIANGVTVHVAVSRKAMNTCLKDGSFSDYVVFAEIPDYYLLRVDTGINAGDNVLYFGVRYLDVDGIERTHFIYPQEASLYEGYELAGGMNVVDNRARLVKQLTGYQQKGQNGDSVFSPDAKGLQPGTTDYYVFTPQHELDRLIRVDVFMRYDKASGDNNKGWHCQGMSLYHVDDFYGTEMAGYYSNQVFISFRGQLIGHLVPAPGADTVSVDFTLEKSDRIFHLGMSESDNYLFDIPATPIEYDSMSSKYLFNIEFADRYGAGIESLATSYGVGGKLDDVIEALTLQVEYTDLDGRARIVRLPFVVNALTWAVDQGYLSAAMPVIGVAQQGENLLFACTLPDVKELTGFRLIFGSTAEEKAGITLANATQRQESRRAELKNETGLNILGFRVYEGETPVRPSTYSTAFNLRPDESCEPLYYYTAADTSGLAINQGETKLYHAVYDSRTSILRPAETKSGYLVSITTDAMDLAATKNEVTVNLHSVSVSGDKKSTGEISLAEQSKDFYGYWPGKDGSAAYQIAMLPGRENVFLLDAPDVSYFTGATLRIKPDENGAVDDWQMRDISIYKYISSGERIAKWNDVGFSDREFIRDCVTSDKPLVRYPNLLDQEQEAGSGLTEEDLGKVYLSKEVPSVTITFGQESRSTVEETEEDVDWEAIRYSMTYEEAHKNLKFASSMCEYTVKVKVAANEGVSSENGDTGSNNYFYFQLSFENGNSGFVLANQQLDSDGFRADRTETFTVRTNRDYGTLSAVYIIPDDTNEDTRDDKLNIESIKIIKNSTEGMARTWTISNVGWIGVGYYDKGAENTIGGRPGRSKTDMAKIFYVDKLGYSINVLFALRTGAYTGNDPQLTGTLTATITYYDSSNIKHIEDYDITRFMYDYVNFTPKYLPGSSAELDSDFMLVGGKTNRFIIPFEDLKRIDNIVFNLSAKQTTTWKFEHLDVYKVESEGLVQININGEYQRSNKTTLLCSDTTGSKSQEIPGPSDGSKVGAMQQLTVQLAKHEIKVDMTSSDWKSTITREPISNDDKLNVYVFMQEAITSPDYKMSLGVQCTHPTQPVQVSRDAMDLSLDGRIFYALDLKAAGINGISRLGLRSNDSGDDAPVGIDRVVVQHIRAGVTIKTYTYNLFGADGRYAAAEAVEPASVSAEDSTEETQTVKLFFTETTPVQPLTADTNDIMVAIRYKSVSDVQRGRGNTSVTYNSRYVALTDITEETVNDKGETVTRQKYTGIGPGRIVEIGFRELDVAEIVGITVASVGSIDAAVDSACVLCTCDGGPSGWYSFVNGTRISNAPFTMSRSTDETVMPVCLTFTTLNGVIDLGTASGDDRNTASGEEQESGAAVYHEIPISMTVYYQNDLKNALESKTFENLNDYVTDGGFKTNETATVEFFLKNTSGIRSIELEPRSAFSVGAAWELGTVACTTEVRGVRNTDYRLRTVNKSILQGHPERINLSTVIVAVQTMIYIESTGTWKERNTTSEEKTRLEVQLSAGRTMNIIPDIQGTLKGYGFTVSAVEGTTMDADKVVDCYYVASDGTQVVFAPPETKGEVSYTIRIASEEMPECFCDITVKVIGIPEETPEEPNPDANIPGREEEQPGSGKDDDDEETGTDDPPEGDGGDTPTEEASSGPSEAEAEAEPEP